MTEKKKQKKKVHPGTRKYAFKEIIWPRRWTLFLGLVLIIINKALGFVIPMSTKHLFDNIILLKDLETLPTFLIVVSGAVILGAITSFALTQLLGIEAQKLIAILRIKVQKHVLRLPISYFDNNKSGALVSRIMTDVEGVRNLVGTGLVQLFGGLLVSIGAVYLLIQTNPTLTAIIVLPLAIFGFVSMKAFAYIRPIFRQRRDLNAEVTGRLTESLNGIRIIKGFNAEQVENDIFEKGAFSLFKLVKKTMTSTSFVTSLGALLMGLATLAIMGKGAVDIIADKMTLGDLIQFTALIGIMVAPILQMGNIGTQMTEAFAGIDKMKEILDLAPEGADPERTDRLENIKGDLQLKNVHFSYDGETEVLKGINIDAPHGSVTALVGSSGSGKSTIAGLVASFLRTEKGEILIDGVNMNTLKLDDYRSHLGLVLQDDFLFEGTIRENVLFSKPSATEAEVEAAVKGAYVKEFTDRFENGLDTLIGERGVKLSGGQRQRLAIARAILSDPRVLILDEATSSLDTQSEAYIQESLKELMKGRTTIVIAHRLSTIKRADQILVIEDGQIAERGKHDELIAKKGRYNELYTYQSRI